MDVKAEILDYINCNETTGALLLTGPWGCGKSYLIKQVANELNDAREAAVAVISLFGLDSISAINKRVKDEYTAFKLGAMGKAARKMSKGFATLTKDGLAVAGIATPGVPGLAAASQGLSSVLSYDIFGFIEVQNSVGNDDKKRKFVLVFDDLERCGISNTQDLLGAINEFVENKQIKVVIIADEAKIGDEEYREYKEKLISRTVRMQKDYHVLIDRIAEDYTETPKGYKDFLKGNADVLKLLFDESKSENIRTLKCVLADFERAYSAWKASNVPQDNMKWVLYTFGAKMFEFREQQKEKDSKKASKDTIGALLARKSFENKEKYSLVGSHSSSLYSFDKWIQDGEWDKDYFVRELQERYIMKSYSPRERFLYSILYALQQDDIEKGLPNALSCAYSGTLETDTLIDLMKRVHTLKKNSITLPCEIDYNAIETILDKRFEQLVESDAKGPDIHRFYSEEDFDNDAFPIYERLLHFNDELAVMRNRKKLIDAINQDGSFFGSESSGSFIIRKCIKEFDDDLLKAFTDKYESVPNARKYELSSMLLSLCFDDSRYSKGDSISVTKRNFQKLVEWLGSQSGDDQITTLINREFIQKINKTSIMQNETVQ